MCSPTFQIIFCNGGYQSIIHTRRMLQSCPSITTNSRVNRCQRAPSLNSTSRWMSHNLRPPTLMPNRQKLSTAPTIMFTILQPVSNIRDTSETETTTQKKCRKTISPSQLAIHFFAFIHFEARSILRTGYYLLRSPATNMHRPRQLPLSTKGTIHRRRYTL
jgi:hypothetical protein